MMKLVVSKRRSQMGAHMLGDQAADIIQGLEIALKMGANKADVDATVTG